MGGQISKQQHSGMIRYRSDGSRGGGKVKEPPNCTAGGSGFLTFLPSFLRRRKTKTKNEMDATASRFFHGDSNTTLSASCSNDSVVSTSSDQALHHQKLSSSGSSGTGDSSSSGSHEDNQHNTGSNSIEHISTRDHYPTTTCCVDDYLICSTDSDTFVDRYGMIVSVQLFH